MNKKARHIPRSEGKNIPKGYIDTPAIFNLKYAGALFIVILISFFVYLPVLNNSLLAWDDDFYIRNNLLIRSFDLKNIFSSYVMGNYHPLTILTLAAEYYFFGLNETGYHSVNLLLHLLNVVLVFYAVFFLSDKVTVALIASLLFGIHPIHVESVAWAAELKDLLYTFFFLASYICYLKYFKEQKKLFYVLALLLFTCSLLSKAMAASLPALFLLTDYFKGRKINMKVWLEKIPFFLLAISLGVVAIQAQESAGTANIQQFSFPQRIVFACYGFISYLFTLVLPLQLSAFYPYALGKGGNIPAQYYAYMILFFALLAFAFYSLRHSPKIFFGLGFFAVTVFLVLQLFPVGEAIMADRYCYIPSIGIFYLAGEGLVFLWDKKLKLISIILLSTFSVFFSVKTYSQCSVWENDMTLWNDVIRQYQNIPFVYYSRGILFTNENKYAKAMDDYNKAIALKPDYANAYYNRGLIYFNEKKNEAALKDFTKAAALKRGFYQAYYYLGTIYYSERKYEAAISNYSKAIELKPDFSEAYFVRGLSNNYTGKKDAACSDMKQAAALGYQRAADAVNKICN